jgi:hypothetical protein
MIERRIVIGLITSTDYCKRIQEIWHAELIESATAKRIAFWCWEYFEKYQKAPGKDIEGIYFERLKKDQLQKDIAEEIEQDILPGLSKEYEREDFNVERLVDETVGYFTTRHLHIHKDSIQVLLTGGKVEEAEKLASEYKPLSISSNNLDNYILSVRQIRKNNRPRPTMLMSPWLREGQTTILYGNFGSGKSLLTLLIGYLLGLKDSSSKECEIGTWQVKKPAGTLYIDGELGEQEMEERISQFEWLGEQEKKYRIRVLAIPEYQIATEDQFYLSVRVNQLKIIQWLKDHPHYKLLVLDSASTLFGLEEENDNSEWNKKINPFLRDLRAISVACLLLHHSGKEGKRGLRGASAMGAMAHNIFKLTNHVDKHPDAGEAWFTITKDKQRAAGFSFRSFSLKFTQNEEGNETHWDVTDNYGK